MIGKKVFHWIEAVVLGVAIVFTSAVVSHRMDKPSAAQAQTFAVQNQAFFASGGADAVAIFTPSPSGGVRIFSVAGFCNTASSADIVIAPSPQGGLNELWQTAIGDVSATLVSYYWVSPLQTVAGRGVSVTLHGCASNSNLFVQYSVN